MTNSTCDLTNSNYNYCPSNAAAILFATLFSIPTAYHVFQAIRQRKPYLSVLIMGGIWEVLGYAVRSVSIHHQSSSALYTPQLLLILLAPLWINAFTYMLVGRMVHYFLDDDRVFSVKARKLTLLFVIFDIIAFVVQGFGGSVSSSDNQNTALNGLHIYTIGVALQIIFNAVFIVIVVRFQKIVNAIWKTTGTCGHGAHQDYVFLLRLVYVVIAIILFRNFYRLIEFAMGLNNVIVRHEWFAYVFDAIPVLSAFVILNIFHPGPKMQGPRSDFSEETKAMKLEKKARKAAKKSGIPFNREAYVKIPLVQTRTEYSGFSQA